MTTVPAGKIWIKFTNKGAKISELYLESPEAKELVEVEKVTTGNAGAFSTKVKAGSYLIACEPGMNDVQIRTPLTVTPGS
jgi:iron uptake system component EfeO